MPHVARSQDAAGGRIEVLAWIRGQPALRDVLPVIVLTSSDHQADVQRVFEFGAHDYMVKPMTFNGLVDLVKTMKREWLDPMRAGKPPVPAQRSR